jgi:UDP-N-acetylmuramoyl-tripeptide--D-alanyl-D-alanine ligase
MATPIPENNAAFSLAEIAAATGGEVRVGSAHSVTGVTTDSRSDVRGKLFVALEGERFDGHDFAAGAARAGAAAILLSRDVPLDPALSVVRVSSALDGLGALARAHRRRWGGRVVAVAGSAGKTTTKTAILSLAARLFPGKVHAARGNLNNQIGVPMVLFGVEESHQLCVLELGTNQRGEVDRLTRVCEPDVGVLTLIDLEHAEGIGDLDAVEAEEGALFAGLGASGTAIGYSDDARVSRQLDRSPAGHKLGYGQSESAQYRLLERTPLELRRTRLELERPEAGARRRVRLETSLVGLPGALASLAALAVADVVSIGSVAPEIASAAFLQPGLAEPGRLEPIELADGILVIDDTYNANPASIRSSLRTACELARERRTRAVVVLGEMRELGGFSRAEHDGVGRELATSTAAALIAISGDAAHYVAPARAAGLNAVFAEDPAAALPLVLAEVRPGDVVLVKASRGVRAEIVVNGLLEAKGRAG